MTKATKQARNGWGRKLAALLAVAAAFSAHAELTVLPETFVTNHVAEGSTTTQAGRLEIASEGRLYKTGGGTWTIPERNVDQSNPLAIRVTNGKVAFAAGTGETPAARTISDGVKNKLLFWGDASDAEATHFVGATSNDTGAVYVDTWYDVRETNPASPTRMYVTADRRHTTLSPQKVTTNGYEALWFGGYSSGRIYNWRNPNGSLRNANNSQVMHVFAVNGVLASFGTIFGSTNGSASSYVATWSDISTAAKSLSSPYWWNSEWCDTHNGRTWVNGERIDGHATSVKHGFHLLEAAMGRYDIGFVNSFFSTSTTKDRSGGDYLCEVLAFTNRLTEVERLEVQNYLMRKWFGPGRPCKDVTLAPGTEVVVDASAGDTADLQILPHGPGTFVKTGSFSYTQATTPPTDFTGTMRIDAGAVTMLSALPVHVEAGDRVTSTRVPAGPRLTVAHDAGNGNLVKDGKESATITGVPSGVKSLTVEAGELTIRAPGTNDVLAAGDPEEIFVENAGFEDHAPNEIVGGVVNVGYGAKHGWNFSGTQSCFIYDYTLWTTGVVVNGTKMADAASKSAWGCANVPPPEGTRALMMRGGNSKAWTEVALARPGVYELEVKARPRNNNTWYMKGVRIDLTDAASSVVSEFGCVRQMDPIYSAANTPFETYRLRAHVAAAGTFRLQFSTTNVYGIVFDDLHLRRLPDARLAWPLPGGTFENAPMLQGAASLVTVFTNANAAEGWAFTQPDGWTDTKPAVGLTTYNMKGRYRDRGGYYNDSRGRGAGGNIELLFRKYGSTAVTTFTPPAGTWWLRAKLGRFNAKAGTLDATVATGGETIRLGAIVPKGRMMGVCQWPTNFTADGSSAVTLTLTQTGNTGTEAGVWADDFELVEAFTPDTETELVKNGGFESLNNWTSIPTTNGSSWIGRTYKEAHWAFGYDPSGGSQFCSMHRFGGVMQDVTLPYPGRYRMSYRSKGRISWADFNGGTYRPFPTRAYLVKDGVTNVLGRSSHQSTNYVQNVFDFTAKKAGVYTLAIQGLWSSEYPSGAEAHIDDVSLRALPGTFDRSPPFDRDMSISVAEGAFLRLDFEGTNRVDRVRLGGRSAVGIIDATSYPDFICGDGALEALAHGTTILFR